MSETIMSAEAVLETLRRHREKCGIQDCEWCVELDGVIAAVAALYAQRDAAHNTRLEWSATLCDGERVTHAEAEAACNALGVGWRLPSRMELESIFDLTRHDPAIDTEHFPDTQSDWYWTSTVTAWSSDHAWVVDFGDADAGSGHRDHSYAFVRAVRSVLGAST